MSYISILEMFVLNCF